MNDPRSARLHEARSFVNALVSGNVEASLATLAEDVQYHVEGKSPFSGTFTGRDEVRAHVAKFLGDANNDFEKIEDWLSSEERVAAIIRHRMDVGGRAAVGRRFLLFEFDTAAKISMVTVFTDGQANFDAMIGADPSDAPTPRGSSARVPTVSGASPPDRRAKRPERQ